MSWALKEKIRHRVMKEKRPPFNREKYLSIGLVFPNTYYVGMSNLGLHSIARWINSRPDSACERFFLPDPEDIAEYQRTRTPLFSYETQTNASFFDVLAFSISFENDFLNIPTILALCGLPILSNERSSKDPLVIAGGIGVQLNPEPIADFFDLFAIGEAEALLETFLEVLKECKKKRIPRNDFLKEISRYPGFYIPNFYKINFSATGTIKSMEISNNAPRRISRAWYEDLSSSPAESYIYTDMTEFPLFHLIELNRGCPHRCNFCLVGNMISPYRLVRFSLVKRSIDQLPEEIGTVGFVGSSIADHPEIIGILDYTLKSGRSLGISSLYLNSLSEELLDILSAAKCRTLTIAPEVASERLLKIINKKWNMESLEKLIRYAVQKGIYAIKLYFLIGLPTETDQDIEDLISLIKKCLFWMENQSKKHKKCHITANLTPFVPKPHTPFQFFGMQNRLYISEKINYVKKAFKKRSEVSIVSDSVKWSIIQAMFSRGDRKLSSFIYKYYQLGGNINKALEECNINPSFYVNRERTGEEIFPWDHLSPEGEKERLYEIYKEKTLKLAT